MHNLSNGTAREQELALVSGVTIFSSAVIPAWTTVLLRKNDRRPGLIDSISARKLRGVSRQFVSTFKLAQMHQE